MLPDDIRVLREALASVPTKVWGITSNDPHWRREVRDEEGRGVAWCGLPVDREAHALAAFVAASNPSRIARILDALEEARKDAARYRWLRGGPEVPSHSRRWPRWDVRHWDGRYWQTLFAGSIDRHIDKDMQEERP